MIYTYWTLVCDSAGSLLLCCIFRSRWFNVVFVDSWKWENPKAVGDIPSPRAAHGCAVFDSRICIFGGISLEGSLNDLHLLNTGCV